MIRKAMPAGRQGFIPVILITVLALVIAVGGVGIGLAWRTNRLDKWLRPNIKEMFRRGERPEEEEEKPGEEPETKPGEDLTKDWKTYENEFYGISFKYPKTYQGSTEPEEKGVRLILSDETRLGNPTSNIGINTGGLVLRCVDIGYEVAIKEGKVEVLSRNVYDNTDDPLCPGHGGERIIHSLYFVFEKSLGPVCHADPEFKYCLFFQCFFSFLRDGPDYEPEWRQIIETIRVTD
ncbi:hypothetical protein CO059_03105 [candidate division WWE3 bacterium CG_4_9_14_0_2_um_filter_48_10]|uniref:Uncharacterized protein n=1 Tax=candidate division WWE3 bacterium CG_4_9_14_0_2_um_filter_48_10 TaxID=1975078 RepID=A0A2M8EHW3_UNCKA|nr:MAG: hypothetical protein CO059_03105 [candidate division WWE3 bacterium CG_4_9_14_0_2_um_filter_48_10]